MDSKLASRAGQRNGQGPKTDVGKADVLISAVLEKLTNVRGPSASGWWNGPCPFHDDQRASFGFSAKGWKCQAACGSGSLVDLVDRLDLTTKYPYEDEKGVLVFEVLRLPGKDFR